MEARPQALCAALVACLALAACAPATKVSVAANATSKYSHVYITVTSIWFNASAVAGPDDTTWLKYPLKAPVTIDLASDSSSAVAQLATDLNLTPGTYNQVLLLPLDSTDPLAASAANVGALYNAEADYIDSTSASVQAPLELLNPAKGISLAGTLKIPRGEVSGNSSAPAPFSLGLAFDGARDLVLLNDGSDAKVIFNPHGSAYDLSLAGAITGTVEVAALAKVSMTNGRTDIQATAEIASTDGTRHVPVAGAPVRSDGTFTLYPLTTDGTTPSSYDVVIHGPAIATVIIRNVPVVAGSATATTATSIGSIAPRDATSYAVNVSPTTSATLPAGAVVRFYQTLPDSGEVPYSIEQSPIDPMTRAFASDFQISAGTLDTGTFVSTGSTIALTAETPLEGVGAYKVAGSAPLYADGALATTVAPSGSSGTSAVDVAVPNLTVGTGAVAASVTATVSRSILSTYDSGELILSRGGTMIDSTSLNAVFRQSASGVVTLGNLPGGTTGATFDSGLYDISVRVWNSATPSTTLLRESFFSPVDLRSVNTAETALSIG